MSIFNSKRKYIALGAAAILSLSVLTACNKDKEVDTDTKPDTSQVDKVKKAYELKSQLEVKGVENLTDEQLKKLDEALKVLEDYVAGVNAQDKDALSKVVYVPTDIDTEEGEEEETEPTPDNEPNGDATEDEETATTEGTETTTEGETIPEGTSDGGVDAQEVDPVEQAIDVLLAEAGTQTIQTVTVVDFDKETFSVTLEVVSEVEVEGEEPTEVTSTYVIDETEDGYKVNLLESVGTDQETEVEGITAEGDAAGIEETQLTDLENPEATTEDEVKE